MPLQQEGHRERMRRRFLGGSIDTFEPHEVLELMLFYAIPRRDTREIAIRLLQRFGSFGASRRKRFPFGSIELELTVHEGTIGALAIGGDFFGMRDVSGLAEALCGTEYDRAAVTARLAAIPVEAYISGCTADDLLGVLFDAEALH